MKWKESPVCALKGKAKIFLCTNRDSRLISCRLPTYLTARIKQMRNFMTMAKTRRFACFQVSVKVYLVFKRNFIKCRFLEGIRSLI